MGRTSRRLVIADLEDIVYHKVLENREKSLVVRRSDTIEFAQHLAEVHTAENFEASQCWLDRYIKRYELSCCRFAEQQKTLYKQSVYTRKDEDETVNILL